MANLSASTWYCDSAQYANVATWAAAPTSYPVGSLVRQNTPALNAERVFVQVTPTTHVSGASEPAWTTTFQGNTPSDGTCSWYECTGRPEVNGDLTNALTWALQHASSTTVTAGQLIYDSVTASIQIVTTGGTIGASAPSFSATAGVTTTDNTATWTSLGLASAFVKWKAPHARLQNAQTTNWAKAGAIVFVGDDHAETQAAALSITGVGTAAAPILSYCVDHTASLPPTSSNLMTTATITTTGASAITLGGFAYFYGITFICGTSGTPGFAINNGSNQMAAILEACQVGFGSGVGSAVVGLGNSTRATKVTWKNTTLKLSAAGQQLQVQCHFDWRNTPSALLGTMPTSLFSSSIIGDAFVQGVDLSGMTSGNLVAGGTGNSEPGAFYFDLCKLGAGVTIYASSISPGAPVVIATRCDSSGTTYQQYKQDFFGLLIPSTAIVRTGGASDGVTPISWSITSGSGALWVQPFFSLPIAIWNTTRSTNRGVTAYGIWNSASLPNNDQVWLEAEYPGSSATPIGSLATQTKANGLATGTALTADSTSTWSSAATARANSTVYTTGQTIAVAGASGGGGLFFCTSGGTSASSQPGGYASAVDGGSVTDGTATFIAGMRFVLTVTLSSPQPALTGYIYATVKVGMPSATFYVDPLLTLS